MYGYIYLTTNTKKGTKYIGKHKSEKFDPNYYGSGILITRELKEYSKDAFTVEILAVCETLEDLNNKEKYFISLHDAVNRNDYLNFSFGGDGGDTVSTMDINRYTQRSLKISESLTGHKVSEETRKILREKQSAAWQDITSDLRDRRKVSDEAKWKDIDCVKNHLEGIHNYWKEHKEERHEELSLNAKSRWDSDEYKQKQKATRASKKYKDDMTKKLKGKLKGYKTMYRDDTQTRVPPDKVQEYLDDGWVLGCKPFTDEHRHNLSHKSSNKNTHDKYIYCVETSKIFFSITQVIRELNLSEYYVKKSLEQGVQVNGYTFIWKEKD